MANKVLVVDDVQGAIDIVKDATELEPYDVLAAGSAAEALDILKRESVDVIITDEKMPGMSGSELLTVVRKKYPDIVRMMLTGHATLEAAIRAINEGEIYRFFTKPCNIIDLKISIRQALEQRDLISENQRLSEIIKNQAVSLEILEKASPGITKVNRDEGGVVIIEDE